MSSDPNASVTVATARNEFEANTLVAVLREAGIDAVAFDAGSTGLGLPLTGGMVAVPVQVRAVDLDRAREALRQNVADSIDVDWDEIDVGQADEGAPATGGRRMPIPVRIGLRLVAIIVLAMLLGAIIAAIRTFR